MINYGIVKSSTRPQEVEMTDSMVFVASNIEPFSETIEEYTMEGYQYNYVAYTKDEYIRVITESNTQAIAALEEELRAAKILLGVE